MAPLSLKIILDDGAITRTMMFATTTKVREAAHIVRDKILILDPNKEYGFFLASADNECSGVWLDDGDKTLEYYMLRDGDSLHYLLKIRNLRLRMLDGAVKTLQLDESKKVVELMVYICEKLRISHSEEYGLCREETETTEDSKNATGTLTLKKKTIQREKDAKLDQLSKKLKTDDHVEWLDQHKTLRELKVEPHEMLLFKRRLFYSDRNVDSRDPVQLNLLYVQTRDGILEGKQVVTETKALEFAGLQCQIQFGDYQEDKHKPGFIHTLKEFLPEQYVSWGVEKKTIKEHKKHIGVPEIEAKHLYTKMARELPTYGVTFFLVKEKQLRKKKLVPRLLGINAQSILRLDEETKEIIQVWLLTQVKSYRADYESFALNFGDYSEKEYVVKTNEGFRIKDILEGYIDIIRRSLAVPRKINFTEGEAMYEDNVERSRGTTIQNYTASKMIESSLVGPSQIISVEQGQQAKEGTQIVTINELVKTNLGNKSQHPIISQQAELQFNERKLSNGFENTMKHFNSKCVTTVVYLSDTTQENIGNAKRAVACLEDALPGIVEGIKKIAANSSPLKSKILLNNLDDLCSYITSLAYETKNSDLSNEDNLIKAQNAAKKAADLSTQMHLSLDPNTKRRSQILMRSRDSFIQDEKTEASLRRASFLVATDKAWTVVESASHCLDEPNETVPSNDKCKQLGGAVAYDLGKLQAAIAMILNSHADPDNIDYESAVKSMQTLSEIMPIFIQDIKHVVTVGEEENGKELKKYVRQLLDCTRAMCMLTGSDNVNKMYDVGNDYADVCKQIKENLTKYNIQTPAVSYALNNEIVKLVQNVGSKVQLLLMGTSELTKLEAADPRATELDAAAIKCTDATECLIACARLTLSTIHEPHSKSAITTAIENISSSAQNMALLWKSLSEKPNRKSFAKQLANNTFEVAKTLDKLRNTFSNIKALDAESEESGSDKQRLTFIATAKSADKIITEANVQLQQISNLPVLLVPENEDSYEHPELKKNLSLSQNLAHLNAAVAALLQAMGDSNHTDYGKAEETVEIISKLVPDIIRDSKYLNGHVDETTWKNISKHLKDMLEATKDICANSNERNEESLNNAASKYAYASGRLTYIYNPRKKSEKENQIMDLSKSAVDEISQMLTRVYDLVGIVSRDDGDLLDKAGVKVVAPAQRLLKITEITAPNINEARCQESLLSAIDLVSDEIESLKNTWTPMLQSSEHKPAQEQLNKNLEVVNKTLKALREACAESDDGENQKKQEFTTSISAAESTLEEASRELQEMAGSRYYQLKTDSEGRNEHPKLQSNLSQKLALLNAAVANLIQATGEPNNSDYEEAKSAVNIISQLTPDIIRDSKRLNGEVDETTWKNIAGYLKDMLNATRDICANANSNADTRESKIESLNDAASQFANASGRLTYIYNPRKKSEKENQIMDLSKSAVDEISQMLTRVYDLVGIVSRDDGDLLDKAGVKVVAPAQRLLKITEITASNINEARCQESLLSAIDLVSDEIESLKNTWTPMLQSSEHKPAQEQLNKNLEVVNKTLKALREACAESDDGENQKKQEFTTSISAAESTLEEASRELQEMAGSRYYQLKTDSEGRNEHPKLQSNLSQKLALLNAAVANLIQATGEPNNSDYEEAKSAVNIISQLTPDIIRDSKRLNGEVDETTWKNIAGYLKDMLNATRDICANANSNADTRESKIESLNDAASQFANASGRLTYIYNPRKKSEKENQIMDLSKSAVDEISQMLTRVYDLVGIVSRDDGDLLDKAGVKVVAPAQRLLKITEITAPNINEARCQESLLSAIDLVSDEIESLKNTWTPMLQSSEHKPAQEQLNKNLEVVNKTLKALREACAESDDGENQKKQEFTTSISAAESTLEEASRELQEMAGSRYYQLKTDSEGRNEHPKLQSNLSQKLALLNAAVANLIQATGEPNNSDYEEAKSAVNIISQLTPDIIRDSKRLNGEVDETTWKNIAGYLKDMLNATRDICANANSNADTRESKIESLNDAASQFANASGRLTYIYNPRKKSEKENQIMDLSKSAVDEISQMLTRVYDLVGIVSRDDGDLLDKAGVKVVAPAQRLLKITEITAPNINEARCQESLLSAIDLVSDEIESLKNTWTPMLQSSEHKPAQEQLNKNLEVVNKTLKALREACAESDDGENQKKQEFTTSISAAESTLEEASRELQEMAGSRYYQLKTDSEGRNEHPKLQSNLSQKLALLNAAVANLIQATGEPNNSDYEEAKSAVNIISQLTPDIIRDSKRLNGEVDETTWKNIAGYLKDMLNATRDICANANSNADTRESKIESLNDAASQFANASGRLTYIYNPRKKSEKENQIMDLSKSAVDEISQMLTRVYDLVGIVSRDDGDLLDKAGVKVVAPAQRLLKITEITAPNINEARCQESLLSAIDLVSDEIESLKNTWTPMLQSSEHKPAQEQLNKNLEVVNKTLKALREACAESDDGENQKKQEFTTSISAAESTLEEASRELQDRTKTRASKEGVNKGNPELRMRLSEKISFLNTAVAALLKAAAEDSNNSDYVKARSAVEIIGKLAPDIIKDSKYLNEEVDETTWNNIGEYLQDMLDATKEICANINKSNVQHVRSAASKLANSSKKLRFIFNPHTNSREEQLIGFTKTAEDELSKMLPEMAKMVKDVRGEHRGQLQKLGNSFERAVYQLHRTAELTVPSINNSQSQDLLLSAIEDVSTKTKHFMEAWKPFLQDPKYIPTAEKLQQSMTVVDTTKLQITKAINELHSEAGADHLQTTVDAAKKSVNVLDKDLKDMSEKVDHLLIPSKSRVDDVSLTKKLLCQKLGQLNAALASILIANTDPDKSRMISAVKNISQLLSKIVEDAKHLHGTTDPQTWNTTSENLKTIVNASKVIYDSIQENPGNVDSAVTVLANSAAVLSSMFNERTDSNKDNQIQYLSRCVVEQISLLLPHVYYLAKTVGGHQGTELDQVGVKLVEGAKQFLKTAQITASTIDDPDCQEVILCSVDHLKELGQDLKNVWQSIVQTPKNQDIKSKLDHNLNLVNTTLEKIRNACRGNCDNLKIQEKLQNLNIWEAKEKIKEAEKLFYDEQNAPELMYQIEGSTEKSVFEKRRQLTQNIAQMNDAVARLLQAMLDQKNPDYKTVKESVEVISNFTPDVIKETMALQVNLDDDSRQRLFEETKSVCKASQEVFSSIEDNSLEELLQGATKYAQASGKLLHITSPHSHPNKERKILELSRNACERTSLLLSRLSRLAGVSEGVEERGKCDRQQRAHELEVVGITVANAAHALLTNAQITAPSINDKNCQAVLISSAERLSDLAQSLRNHCLSITQNAEARDIETQLLRDLSLLNKDILDLKTTCQSSTENESLNSHHQTHIPLSENLQLESQSQLGTDHLLQEISDTARSQGDNEDTLVVEDTPLRQLALKILESVKTKVKSKSLALEEQKELEKFSQDLSDAVNTLDLSNSRCVNEPLDSGIRQDLELAIMDLQQICLLSKRRHTHNNVVDLTDYIDDVISMVHNFSKTADNIQLKSTDQGIEALEELRNKCMKIQENENKLQNPKTQEIEGGSIIDNMMRVEEFAKDCDDQVHEMNSLALKIESETARNILQDKLQCLTESCDLLRFAAKSSISSAASVEFDETIQNLQGFEKNIENILKTNEDLNNLQKNKTSLNPLKHTIQSAQTKVMAAIFSGNTNNLPKELTRYAVTLQNEITAPNDQIKLKNHLHNLLYILKLETIAKSRRMATWQDVKDYDSIMTSKMFEELETFSHDIDSQKAGIKGQKDNIILDNDIRSMLLSNKSQVEGEPEELKRRLQKQIDKMSTVVQTIVLSFHKPEMLSRSLHMALGSAEELTVISKGLKGKNLLQNKRIEEATQEVKMATYNLIKTSESLSQSPVPDSRRKLLEACRSLNEALNKFARTTCPESPEFCELQRDLQLATQLGPQSAPATAPLLHCMEQMQSQLELINILRSSGGLTTNCRSQLRHVTSCVCSGTEFGAQCAYLLSLSDEDRQVAHHGVIDRYRINQCTNAIQDTCLQIICSGNGEQAKELESILNKQINQLQESLDDSSSKVNDDKKEEILKQSKVVHIKFKELQEALNSTTFRENEVTPRTFKLMDAIKKLNVQIDKVPRPKLDDSPKKKEWTKDVTENMRKLLNNSLTMVKKASCCEENDITWENIGGNDVVQVFEALISCVRKKGAEAGLIESEDLEKPAKSYVQTQIAIANTWLTKPASKEDKVIGVKAAETILELAEKICEDLGDGEKEELNQVIIETKQLLNDCTTKYNSEKASQLRERLQDVRKLCERGAVTRVVESFLHEPQHEIDQLVHEPDKKKRKFLLEKKIAELLAHLARVTKTARFVADTGVAPRQTLINTTDQVELLAPVLVKAAEKRINHLDDQVAIENYQKLLANYAESLMKVRDLCDRSVDPIDFSRAAGETIHRIKEESSGDPQKSVHASSVIIKLGSRVVEAGLQAPLAKKDAELRRTLRDIKTALSRHEQMGDVAAEILKKTSEVESALGGENIFQKEPDSNQPIYAAALQLHASLRGWSARHNDAVHGAKLLAVLMARLSHFMDTDNKRELIITSKAIVDKSREIADIATKLAAECTDMRIRSNLLQVCERIPTISGQLKMLTTVKSSSLGQQGCAEDKESMNMLVGNAQNLMISIQEVVKAAESASVKIMSSQRGYRMKWVQRNYY